MTRLPSDVRCGHCACPLTPRAIAGTDGGDPLCRVCCHLLAESIHRERMDRRQAAARRDPEDVRYCNCFRCGCDLLAENEAEWANDLPRAIRDRFPEFPIARVAGRPVCSDCHAADTDPRRRPTLGWDQLRAALDRWDHEE